MTPTKIEEMQGKHLEQMKKESPRFAAVLARAYKGKSKASIIKAFCLECQGRDGDAVGSIRHCTAPRCPLFNIRPYVDRPSRVLSPERAKNLRSQLLRRVKGVK